VTHDPSDGRAITGSPQFHSISDGSWLGNSATIERTTLCWGLGQMGKSWRACHSRMRSRLGGL
jgi:hypothetical protein